ncbi:hypothetical protein ALC60_02988 [Trachymyrmex zeteki]|uniref:Uncharacterized protein n=1 Tax=Mycetomoellerius zeteki TaxID=64791 RepID=A0A151XC69_9HYME|nr:hypothetical protein ALC60_02988 [Trachymyrmex zeteki]
MEYGGNNCGRLKFLGDESLRAETTIRAAADNAKAALNLSDEQFRRPPCEGRPRNIPQAGARCLNTTVAMALAPTCVLRLQDERSHEGRERRQHHEERQARRSLMRPSKGRREEQCRSQLAGRFARDLRALWGVRG